MNDTKEIFEYIRRRKNGKTVKTGVIVGLVRDNNIYVGWSKCNNKAGDEFNRETGLKIARSRTVNPIPPTCPPLAIQTQIRRFGARCVRYFKGIRSLTLPIETV